MSEVRFGIIGCGAMPTQVHVSNLASMSTVRIAAYCDLNESKARKLMEQFGGDYITTEMGRILADKTIDAVTIAVGPKAHPALVQAAAKAGKHVFVEKPLAVSLADALDTVRAVEQAGIKFQHGTCNRLAPMVKVAKRMLPKPHYSYCHAASTVTHMPVHNLDLAINLFHDSPVTRVYGSGGQRWNLAPDKDLPADSYAAVLTFADGSIHSYLQTGNIANAELTKYHFELFGDDCAVYLARRYKECQFTRGGKVQRTWKFEGDDQDRGPYGYMGHYEELEDLAASILANRPTAMGVRQAAYVCAVENAILQSVASGQAVEFAHYLQANNASFLLEGVYA